MYIVEKKKLVFLLFSILGVLFSGCKNDTDRGREAYQQKDFPKAVGLYAKACDVGDAKGCYELGKMYYKGEGVQQDKSKSIKLYTKSCDNNDMNGCNYLAGMYANGESVQRNTQKAVVLLTKACDNGNAQACDNLGIMTDDKSKSFKYFEKSCNEGFGLGCVDLGLMYQASYIQGGYQVQQEDNLSKAFELYKKACDLHNESGCNLYRELN